MMFAMVLAGSFVLAAPAPKEERRPDKPPPGQWVMERFEHDGEPMRPAPSVALTEKSLRFGQEGQPPDKQPTWAVSYFRVAGEGQADFVYGARGDFPIQKAIWKVEDDRLVLCVGPMGSTVPRPTAFVAPKGSGRSLYVFRRVRD
jgi:hypothetical protein